MYPQSPPEEQQDPLLAWARAHWWALLTVVAMIGALIAASTLSVPYYAISPGGALPVAPLVHVADGPTFPPKGGVFLCTVSLGPTTLLEALQGWLDPTTDVVKRSVIVPPNVSPGKLREVNLQAMDTSKEQAIGVAFEQLGYDAITGQGAEVVAIRPHAPADGALVAGDTITAIDTKPIELHSEAVEALSSRKPGDTVHLTVTPKGGGAPKELDVVLAAKPGLPREPMLGVVLRTAKPAFHFPYKVDIDSEQIGGPSAGLAFTLEVLDVLTKGELTGGRLVAATGTMEIDGSVGVIGGVAQKTAAVKKAGVRLFLVPMDEVAQARRHAGKHLRIEGVRNIHDALRILAGIGGNGRSGSGRRSLGAAGAGAAGASRRLTALRRR